MLKNAIKLAFRNLKKNRFYSAINMIGLSIGLATGILILLWVEDEKSYDSFHHQSPQIYQTLAHIGSDASAQIWTTTPPTLALYGPKNIPAIRSAVRISDNKDIRFLKYQDVSVSEFRMIYTDSSLWNIFDFPFLQGSANTALSTTDGVVLTQHMAHVFFGTQNPMGKAILADEHRNLIVTGIIRDIPGNSSITPDIILSNHALSNLDNDWGNYGFSTFFLLRPDARPKDIAAQLTSIHRDHQTEAKNNFYELRPIDLMHLYEADGSSSRLTVVNIFFAIAVLILLVAGINYINLSTARSVLRSREVSIRKIIGAPRWRLFEQFMSEFLLLFFITICLAIGLILLVSPLYEDLVHKRLSELLTRKSFLPMIGITLLSTVLLASIYPAWQFISYRPVQVLRGKLSFGISAGLLRKILVVIQFTFSVILIIGTVVISRQLQYIRHKELGYDRSYVFTFGLGEMSGNFSAVKNELLREPSILGVSGANQDIIEIQSTTGDVDWEGKLPGSSFLIHPFPIDTAFFPMFRIQLAQGRPFTGSAADSGHYILNETAVRQAGITDPIGKSFTLRNKRGTIIGVARDMHLSSLKNKIEPAVFVYRTRFGMAYVKTNKGLAPEAIRAVETQWKKYNGSFPFDYTFLDEHFNSLYASDQRTATLFDSFSVVAILISCLGLLGLVTYSMEVRRKEIAIRKTLGAGTPRIMALISRQFIALITCALFLAAPLAWWLMNKWLQNFAYHVDMQWWIILMAGLIALFITFLTIGIQIARASMAAPAKNLRSE